MNSVMQISAGSLKWNCRIVFVKLGNPSKSSIAKKFGQLQKFSVSSSLNFNSISTPDKEQCVLWRREAVGLGFLLSFINLFPYPQTHSAAAEDEATSCEFVVSPSGLAYCDRTLGNGSAAVKGQLIKAHYVGKLENGKVFDSSYKRGKPLTFRIGVGEVIKGWDEGIVGGDGVPPMKSGGKRSLKIPPELAYGMRGAGCQGGTCVIPPNAVLLFDVEFVGKA